MRKIFVRYWIAPAAWLSALVVYLLTLCPTVYVEGSGELIGAVHFLGTAHPTGYPLFSLIGRLFSALLPFASVAYKINIATACSAACATAVLALLLRFRGCRDWVALSGALVFAFSFTFWSQSVIAEVYGLSLAMALAAMGLGLWAVERRDARLLLLTSFMMGLGLTAHLNQVLVWPGLILLAGWKWPGLYRRLLLLGQCLLAGLLGYSLVIYLLVRNGRGQGFHWGSLHTAELFWKHLTAATYRSSFFSMPWEAGLLNAQRWAIQLTDEFHLVVLPFIVWGAWRMVRQDRGTFLVVVGALLANLTMAFNYHRDPNGLGVFFLLSFVALAIALGYGLNDVVGRLLPLRGGRWMAAILVLLLPVVVLAHNYERADRSQNYVAFQYGVDILTQLPPNAVLVADGDDVSFILDYLWRVEGMRPDVDLYNRNGLGTDLLSRSERGLARRERSRAQLQAEADLILKGKRQVFYLYPQKLPVKGYEFVPTGLAYQVRPVVEQRYRAPDEIPFANAATENFYRDPWVRKIQSNYWFMEAEKWRYSGAEEAACRAFNKAAKIAYDSCSLRFNVGLMFYKYNKLKEAGEHIGATLKLDPWNPAPHRLMAQILRRQGRQEEAQILHKKAVELGDRP
jgi:hypothetical protein